MIDDQVVVGFQLGQQMIDDFGFGVGIEVDYYIVQEDDVELVDVGFDWIGQVDLVKVCLVVQFGGYQEGVGI